MDYAPWLKLEYWSVKTFLFLCEGKDPATQPHVAGTRTGYIGNEPPTPRAIFENQINKAGKEGELVPRSGPTADLDNWDLPPLALIRFAQSVEFEIPQPLRDFASKKGATKAGRQRRITHAIERARDVLQARHGKEPTAREVFTYLVTDDDTGVIDDVDGEILYWEDQKGVLQETRFKTMANTLSRIRSRTSTESNPGYIE